MGGICDKLHNSGPMVIVLGSACFSSPGEAVSLRNAATGQTHSSTLRSPLFRVSGSARRHGAQLISRLAYSDRTWLSMKFNTVQGVTPKPRKSRALANPGPHKALFLTQSEARLPLRSCQINCA